MIPFSPPFIDDDIINEVTATLRSGWITTGPKTKALEDFVAGYSNVPKVLGVNSATSGLFLLLKWFGVNNGDEVIIPAYTYSATALVVHHAGAKIIMVDVGDDFNITINNIRKAISPQTKAIIPVDFAGLPCDYDAILKLVNEPDIKKLFTPKNEIQSKLNRILILSDAAHSLGAKYNGKKSGSLADITVFSLHAVKNVTSAEGGLVCINLPAPFDNEKEYAYLRLFALNGQTKDAFSKTMAGAWRYDIAFPGYKFNMPDVCASIALAQIRKYEDFLLPERKRIALNYSEAFSILDWAINPILETKTSESSYHIFPLRIKNITEEQRDRMINSISNAGVSVNVHFIPLPLLTAFKDMGYSIADFPVTYSNYKCEISLPIYPQLTNAQVTEVINSVKNAYLSI